MALPSIKTSIQDGALGVAASSNVGYSVAIGVASKLVNGVQSIHSVQKAEEILGRGVLADHVKRSLSLSSTVIYAIALEGSVAGSISSVKKENVHDQTGDAAVSVSGKPRSLACYSITVMEAGALNDAVLQVQVDKKEPRILSAQATLVLEDEGFENPLTLHCSGVFALGDVFTFDTTAPKASNEEILNAVDQALELKLYYEWIALAGQTQSALWASLAAKAQVAEQSAKYVYFKVQAEHALENEDTESWVQKLVDNAQGGINSTRVQIYAGALDGDDLLGYGCGMSARRLEHEPVNAVKYGAIGGALSLKPVDLKDAHIDALMQGGYTTARAIEGLSGLYITSGEMACSVTSDFRQEEQRRVMDKACRAVRQVQLNYINDVVAVGADGSMEGLEIFKAVSEQPLKQMLGDSQISAYELLIDKDQDILATKRLKVQIRITPLGKMSYIENEISYYNPNLGA